MTAPPSMTPMPPPNGMPVPFNEPMGGYMAPPPPHMGGMPHTAPPTGPDGQYLPPPPPPGYQQEIEKVRPPPVGMGVNNPPPHPHPSAEIVSKIEADVQKDKQEPEKKFNPIPKLNISVAKKIAKQAD